MGRVSFDHYGARARLIKDPLLASARLLEHRGLEALVVDDISEKLALMDKDMLLDIGCGVGALTELLSKKVKTVVGVDHADCVARLQERGLPNVEVIAGNWLDVKMERRFSKILAYDVVHYLGSPEEVVAFIVKALGLLMPRGRMLVGDIPSDDMRSRFDDSLWGNGYNTAWNHARNGLEDEEERLTLMGLSDEEQEQLKAMDAEGVRFGDDELLMLVANIRRNGFQAWLLPQPESLPFGVQREDLLICRP